MDVPLRGETFALVKVVSLDFSGTLVGPDLMDYFWLELVPLLYSEKQGIWLSEAKDEVFAAYEDVGKEELRWYQPRYWFGRFGILDLLPKALDEAVNRMKVYPDVSSLLPLKEKYRFVICSNMTDDFLGAMVPRLGFEPERCFSAVSAFSMTSKKGAFYAKVADALGVPPSEIVHVGDDIKVDFEAPKEAGWSAVFLDRQRHHPDVSPAIVSLRSLPPLLERLGEPAVVP
jgi:HAD superfamily hydrolase (TIGR01549 family)